jgi:hypothetical protein
VRGLTLACKGLFSRPYDATAPSRPGQDYMITRRCAGRRRFLTPSKTVTLIVTPSPAAVLHSALDTLRGCLPDRLDGSRPLVSEHAPDEGQTPVEDEHGRVIWVNPEELGANRSGRAGPLTPDLESRVRALFDTFREFQFDGWESFRRDFETEQDPELEIWCAIHPYTRRKLALCMLRGVE